MMTEALSKGVPFSYITEPEASVKASQSGSLKSFIMQRVRWASKTGLTGNFNIIYTALITWLCSFILTYLIVASIFIEGLFIWFAIAFTIKTIADLILLLPAARLLKQRSLLKGYPLAALFYYFYISLTGIISLFGRFSWKGRYSGQTKNRIPIQSN